MTRLLLLVFLCFTCACGTSPERQCTNFKTGTFSFTTTLQGLEKTSVFRRQKNIEIEELEGKKDTASIRWINECEYVLKKLKPKSRSEEQSIHIKILVTTDSSYTFEYNAIGDSRKFKGEAIKIN